MTKRASTPDLPQGSRLWFIDEAGEVQCVPFDDGLPRPQPAAALRKKRETIAEKA
jgi:hypothetical protein